MKGIIRYRRTAVIITALTVIVFSLIKCTGKDKKKEVIVADKVTTLPNDYKEFAGSATCAKCHSAIYDKHVKTAHYLTSQPATEKTILGSFKEGSNIFNYNQLLLIKMHRSDSGLYQSVFYKGEQKKDFRFGLVTGSGAKGQTYLYWQGNKLFQMPISYFTAAGQWANSPGFPSDKVMFDKPITTRCLECHATYAGLLSEPDIKQEEFDKQRLILGVDCEKCHGAGAKHVEFQTANPAEKKGKYIVKQAALSRQLQLDMCRLCHDGSLNKTTPSFRYKAGEDLANYFSSDTFTTATVNTDNADVHGNQFGLLRASKCFQLSNMTCNTCHSPHENERGKAEVFSQRCQGCHKNEHLPIAGLSAGQLSNNCIDCHMPSKQSRTLTLYLKDKELPAVAMVRSHYISNYPEEVKKYVEGLKKGK